MPARREMGRDWGEDSAYDCNDRPDAAHHDSINALRQIEHM